MVKSNHIKIFFLFFWLLVPTLTVMTTDQLDGKAAIIALLIYSIFVFLIPLPLFSSVRNYFLLWSPLMLIAPIYAYATRMYDSAPGDGLVSAAIHTNIFISMETLSIFGWKVSLIPLSAIAYMCISWGIGPEWRFTTNFRKNMTAALLVYASAGIIARQFIAPYMEVPPLMEDITANVSFPSNLILSFSRVTQQSRKLTKKSSVHGRLTPHSGPVLVVLVIGESLRSDHLGINGYARNTTPDLSSLGSDLLTFSDVASTANFTYGAVPNIESKLYRDSRATLIQTFHEAGFKTAWLSNQEPNFGRDADVSSFATNSADFHLRKDTALIPLFKSFIRQSGPAQFIVLHMIGSHVRYDERYSYESRRFRPTLSDIGLQEPGPADKAAAINSYDNTIIESDKFLREIIDFLKGQTKPAIMLFTSDHGENLYDDQRNLFMHGQRYPTHYDMHVPLLVWMNSIYITSHPDYATALRANVKKRISHMNVFDTVLDFGDIGWEGKKDNASFARSSFKEQPRPIFSIQDPVRFYDDVK